MLQSKPKVWFLLNSEQEVSLKKSDIPETLMAADTISHAVNHQTFLLPTAKDIFP